VGTRVRATVAAVTLLLLAGCGDDEEKEVVSVPPDPFADEAGEGVKRVEGDFTVAQVMRAYQEEIGVSLRIDERVPGQYAVLNSLGGPPFAPIAPDLGLFSVYVADSEAAAEALIGRPGEGEAGTTREPGVRFAAEPVLISAKARFGNVVLDWNADDLTQTDERFQRLAAPLESLDGEPPPSRPALNPCVKEQTTGRFSAEDGDPTCRLGPQVITFAPQDAELEFGDVGVFLEEDPEFLEVLENEREDLSVGPEEPKPPQEVRSKGEFLILRLQVDNRGEVPVERLPAALLVGNRLFQPDLDDAFYVDRTNPPFPLDPGESGPYVVLFDLPATVATTLTAEDAPPAWLVLVDPRDPFALHVPGSAPNVARIELDL
jgi:hypothetical protein